MGPLQNIIGLMPGMPKEVRDVQIEDRQVARIEAIIRSMTPAERADPDLIDGSRRNRIAAGSGTQPGEVAALVKQFNDVSSMMKRLGGFGSKRIKRKEKKQKGKGGGRVTGKGSVALPKPDVTKLAEASRKPGGLRLPGL
jgi:signal recognition particle subunit SRP54